MIVNTIHHIITGYNQVDYFSLRIPSSSKILDFIVENNMFSLIYEDTESEDRTLLITLIKGEPYNISVNTPYFGKYTTNKVEILTGVDNFRIQNISMTYYLFLDKSVSQIRDEKINSLIN